MLTGHPLENMVSANPLENILTDYLLENIVIGHPLENPLATPTMSRNKVESASEERGGRVYWYTNILLKMYQNVPQCIP